MSWRSELAARLPDGGATGDPNGPNRPAPPGSSDLRSDILDELEDHLQCAMDREAIGTTDPNVARRRVLDRFGDPATIARRLFFDAMKEQIMNQRLAIGINLLVGAVVVVVGIVTVMTVRNGQAFQSELLDRMERIAASVTAAGAAAPPVAAVDSMQWGKLEARVVDELGDPVADARVTLSGRMYGERQSDLPLAVDAEGRAESPPVLPGNYFVRTTLNNRLTRTDPIVIIVGDPTRHEIRVPVPRDLESQPVRFRLTLPPELDGVAGFAAVELSASLSAPPTVNWQAPPIRLAIRHDGKVAPLPSNSSLLSLDGTAPVGVSMDALEWSDTLDVDRALRIGSVEQTALWLAVDTTRPNLVYRVQVITPGRIPAESAIGFVEDSSDDGGDRVVSVRVSERVLMLLPGSGKHAVSVTTGGGRLARVVVPSLERVGDPPPR